MVNLNAIDFEIDDQVLKTYEGYDVKWYASGFNFITNEREVSYDITMKDGSGFVAVGKYNTEKNTIEINEIYGVRK